jgi:hypothetical protein
VYSLTILQELATAAGYDPVRGLGSSCLVPGASGKCVLPWGSGTKAVSSIVLVANGVGFAVCQFLQPIAIMAHLPLSQIMTLVYATIGPAADYGTFGRWLLLVSTAICWAAQFASMSLTCKPQHLHRPLRLALSSASISSEPLGYCDGIVYYQLRFTGPHPIIFCGTFPAPRSQYTSLT